MILHDTAWYVIIHDISLSCVLKCYFKRLFAIFNFKSSQMKCQWLSRFWGKFKIIVDISSVKWSDPGHFLKSQGNLFLWFPCTLFDIFVTSKNSKWDFKKFPRSLHFTLLWYLNNYLCQLINLKQIRDI